MLGVSVLLGSVWVRHPEDYIVGEEERAGRGVIKLAAVVALNCLDRGVELCACVRKKVRQDAEGVGFEVERKIRGVGGKNG